MTSKAPARFPHPVAFWTGSAAITAGVVLHLPEFWASRDMGYEMAGMAMSPMMLAGMLLIVTGVALAAYGLFRAGPGAGSTAAQAESLDGPMTAAHWKLSAVLVFALVVDVMKPATLGFVLPGMMEEYGLSELQVAALPLVALTGTTIGSVVWGLMADRLGRRGSILLAALMFIGTAICGAMPGFGWNLVMCFLMGMSAGGLLPLVFALMAETMPTRHRGWTAALVGGLGGVGGYLAASGASALLEPLFGWRVLWLVGLPTGLVLIALNRFIPESSRFLLREGRVEEAREVLSRFGVVLRTGTTEPVSVPPEGRVGIGRLFRAPYVSQTTGLVVYGVAWGVVYFGFLTWLPTTLRDLGLRAEASSALLTWSALLALPGSALVAWLYGFWSSRKSLVALALATAASLLGIAWFGSAGTSAEAFLLPLVALLLLSSSGAIAILAPYAAEVYPTAVRATGAGVTAGSSKLGGILGPPAVGTVIALAPGLTAAALVVAVPVVLSAALLWLRGVETTGLGLEEISDRIEGRPGDEPARIG